MGDYDDDGDGVVDRLPDDSVTELNATGRCRQRRDR